ncbi:OsmC family protein [Pseudomonas sp. SA3-5]|uniref:OsmC family protein n=1 Tax=Pseudomonas aestuarii TaxID=3018340 RepID=A0ABT4XH11_9PSED|nr:OsmC family protein [Pseudomonas aestuarii]MDA7087462.1 OsmC family protein [Pseudomonas aestuarii]
MDKDSRIRDTQNRIKDVFKKRQQKALSTNHATAVIKDGLTCTFTQGEFSAVMDMPAIMGGDAAGPTPGFFARAGIAGCVSIGIKQTAVMAGAVFDTVTVDIETDFDDGAAMGLGDASAAPLETRLAIRISTNLPAPEVFALVEKALSMDPWFLALRDAQHVKFNLIVDE